MFLIFKNKKLVLLEIILIFFLFLVGGNILVSAQVTTGCINQISGLQRFEKCRVNANDSLIIKAEGCEYGTHKVTNSASVDFFIPTRTCTEWESFLLYHPSSVSVEPCANIVFNAINKSSLNATTETPFINTLQDWGYNVTVISDADMATYDFSNTDLLIVRGRDTYAPHPYGGSLLGLTVPIISMDRYVSRVHFGMATSSSLVTGIGFYFILDGSHPFSSGFDQNSMIEVYTVTTGMQLLDRTSTVVVPILGGVTDFQYFSLDNIGVAIRSAADDYPRIHWAAHNGSYFTSDAWNIFQNVVEETVE